jgi:Ricin-type beta-trefoil lectin domain-like
MTPNQAKYATSTSLSSGWSSLTSIGDSTTFFSQSATVVAVQGSSGTAYLYAGDRWAGAWSGPYLDSMYVWLPLSFSSNTAMTMSWANSVTIDAGAGTITGANNSFTFTGKGSGKVLEVKGASPADSATVDQWTGNAGSHQRWTLNYDGAGYFRLTNVNSGKVLDVPSSSTADGAALIQLQHVRIPDEVRSGSGPLTSVGRPEINPVRSLHEVVLDADDPRLVRGWSTTWSKAKGHPAVRQPTGSRIARPVGSE